MVFRLFIKCQSCWSMTHFTFRNNWNCIKSIGSGASIQKSLPEESPQHEVAAPAFILSFFFSWVLWSSPVQQEWGMVPLQGTGYPWGWGQRLAATEGWNITITSQWKPHEDKEVWFSPESTGGNRHCNTGRQWWELEGVPQLYFLTRMWGNVLYLNCWLVEQCSSKRVWKTVKQMCTEKSQLCNVFPWSERPQCVILGLGWVTQCGWARTLSALLLGQLQALRGICSQAQA